MNLQIIPAEHREEILKMKWLLELAAREFDIIGPLGDWLQDGGRAYDDIPPGIREEFFYKDLQTGETHACRVWQDMGHSEKEMAGKKWQELIHPEEQDLIEKNFHKYVYTEKVMVGQSMFRIRNADGEYRWLLSSSAAIQRSDGGEIFRYIGRDVDIGNRLEKELSLKQRIHEIEDQSLRERTLMEAAGRIAGATDDKDLLLALEESAAKIFVQKNIRIITRSEAGCRQVLGPELPTGFDWTILENASPGQGADPSKRFHFWQLGDVAEGHVLIILSEGSDPGPEVSSVMNILRPIILGAWERVRHFNTLRKHATTDPLTGAWNRRAFMDQAKSSLRCACEDNRSCAVAILDIDHFKKVNDKYGHPFGDKVLKEVATSMKNSLRSGDFMCRWGGEEFALYLEGTATDRAKPVLDRIRMAAGDINTEMESAITLSAGVFVITPDNHETLESALKKADDALLKAKETGRNKTLEYMID